MKDFQPWTPAEILEYLDRYGCKIVLRDGVPHLEIPNFPEDSWGRYVKPQTIKTEILPHLKAQRDALLKHLKESDPAERARIAREQAREAKRLVQCERRERIASVLCRAKSANRKCFYMARPELRVTSCGHDEPPVDAVYICVEGDERWTLLPGEVAPEVMAERKKSAGRKAKKARKEKAENERAALPDMHA